MDILAALCTGPGRSEQHHNESMNEREWEYITEQIRELEESLDVVLEIQKQLVHLLSTLHTIKEKNGNNTEQKKMD